MRTIAVINQKGGCGKTTTSINLGAGLARRGFRTLLVDLDPQSHCAAGLGVPEDRIDLDVSDALRAPADQALDRDRLLWRVGRGFDLLPSRMKLAGLEAARGGLADMEQPQERLNSVIDRLTRAESKLELEQAGDQPRRYDAVVIDCPPSIGLLSYNALAAASEVLIPVETSYFSLRGAGKQIQTARSVAKHVGVEPRVRLLATMFDPSLPLARDLLDDLRDRFGAAVVPLAVRMDPEVKEAASFGRPIEEHAPESMGAEDYASLCEWLIERAGLDRPEPGTDAEGVERPRLPEQTLEARPVPGLTNPGSVTMGSVIPGAVANGTAVSGIPTPRSIPQPEPTPSQSPAPAGTSVAPKDEPMSRAKEIAMRTAAMPREPRAGHQPSPRLVLPPKPVAIELSTEPAIAPNLHPAAPPPKSEPNAEALRHLWGVCSVEGGLFFVQPATGVRSVSVVGDFNGWDPTASEMTRRTDLGIFECRIECPPGRFQYRLVVDGDWCCDAYNPARVPNGLGGENNLAVV